LRYLIAKLSPIFQPLADLLLFLLFYILIIHLLHLQKQRILKNLIPHLRIQQLAVLHKPIQQGCVGVVDGEGLELVEEARR
jgi:hypothetical protein